RAVNLSISSPVIANSTTRRHPAMMPLLVSPPAKQGIRHQPIGSMMQVSWNRSSSRHGRLLGNVKRRAYRQRNLLLLSDETDAVDLV
ncbi:MAG TPA: hypothetical protein VGI22_21155, partial [Xanthobacteraceae bacterium]